MDERWFHHTCHGHEIDASLNTGCGYVEAVGASVKDIKPQDPVLLSYMSCGDCYACVDRHPAYCTTAFELNFKAERDVYATPGEQEFAIGGTFFGQSSFASKAVVKQRSVVNLRGVVDNVNELRVLAPLGCGVQTGSGAIVNVAGVKPGQDVAVLGVGGVGMSAIIVRETCSQCLVPTIDLYCQAAHMRKCKTVIAIDRTESRLELARSLGATHTINTSSNVLDVKAEVLKATDGAGVHVSLDTTGVKQLARQSYDYIRNLGKVVQVGLAKPTDTWDIPMVDMMDSGKQILGCVQGDVTPQSYALEMIRWYREGEFPFDKIITFYEAKDFKQALHDMKTGIVVKPVILWSTEKEGDSLAPSL